VEKEFTEQISKHQKVLHKICSVYFYRNPYKEDYYQEMLIRLWKSFPSYKGQSSFSTWLYRVALNTAIDILRKQAIRPTYVELSKNEHNLSDFNHQPESENRDRLYAAINQLSEMEKAIIILYLEDYDYKEISEIIGISANNAGVKINRIKNQLFKKLGNEQK
jgi:RNA polymerase sigma-70 factor (ECF subfamily)